MPMTSTSLLRHLSPPPSSSSAALLRRFSTPLRRLSPPYFPSAASLRWLSISAGGRHNPTKVSRKQPSKQLLKARESVKQKQFSTLAPVLSPDEELQLSDKQAIGVVSSSQANFMRVVIQPSRTSDEAEGVSKQIVDLEASRSSGEVVREAFVDVESSRSFVEVDGVGEEFVDLEASRSFVEVEGVGGEFVDLEASRSSSIRFSQGEVGREKLEKNRDECDQVEGFRRLGEVVEEGLRRSGEMDGVEFSESGGVVEGLERGEGFGNEGKREGVELLCVVKAVLKKIKRRVLVGDRVLVGSIDWVDRRGMIENVFQRKSEVADPPVANVDNMVVLFSMEQPKIEPYSLTCFLVEAESTGIPFSLALNKSELVSEETLLEWESRLRKWGYLPVFCSIESKHGLDKLQFLLREQTSVIVGPSGVGKSSLINALRGDNTILGVPQDDNCLDHILGSKWLEEQRVGEISMRSGRGKHTTRHVSLLPLTGGGYLADTPGFNQPSLIKVTKQSLAHHFPEIRKLLEDSELKQCSFGNCLHIGEPGCVVKGDWERYPYYLQLLEEIGIREALQLRTHGTKREGDVRYKTGEMGVLQAEPRLEMKRHRRQSRKRVNQSIMEDLDEYVDDVDNDDDDDDDDDENPVIRAVRKEQQ